MSKYLDLKGLQYFVTLMKKYVDLKVDIVQNKRTNCPNCGAVITDTKCEYCGTDFNALFDITR